MSVHLATRKIKKEWTDYNEHMNMAYYVLIFDEAWEIILNKVYYHIKYGKIRNIK